MLETTTNSGKRCSALRRYTSIRYSTSEPKLCPINANRTPGVSARSFTITGNRKSAKALHVGKAAGSCCLLGELKHTTSVCGGRYDQNCAPLVAAPAE